MASLVLFTIECEWGCLFWNAIMVSIPLWQFQTIEIIRIPTHPRQYLHWVRERERSTQTQRERERERERGRENSNSRTRALCEFFLLPLYSFCGNIN
ncbi:hypothetical protein ACSBR2_024968 [Camellia fascicularis]